MLLRFIVITYIACYVYCVTGFLLKIDLIGLIGTNYVIVVKLSCFDLELGCRMFDLMAFVTPFCKTTEVHAQANRLCISYLSFCDVSKTPSTITAKNSINTNLVLPFNELLIFIGAH